jgi:F-type H+-transporting ATPase subunit epsilon
MRNKILCNILTPEKYIYEGEIDFAVVQVYDGERGFLINHAPFITKLGRGEVRLMEGQSTEYLVLEGGLLEIVDNNLTILAEKGYLQEDLDPDLLQKELDEVRELKSRKKIDAKTEEGYTYLETERNLKIKLKVSKR